MSEKTPNHELGEVKRPASLEDVDLFGPGAPEHWYQAYEILHREAPVHRIPGEGFAPGSDGFILSRFEDIEFVVKNPDRFPPTLTLGAQAIKKANIPVEEQKYVNAMMMSIVTLRPNMKLWRSHKQELTDPWVGTGADRNEEMIRGYVHELIDRWINKHEIDFISEFARPLPQMVMATILGFPLQDIPQLAKWGEAQVMPFVYGKGHRNELSEEQVESQFTLLDGFKEYVQQKVEEKRKNPADDMISFLTQVTYKALGRKLTDIEINGVVYAMVIGGLETTQYAIEEEAQLLCEIDGLWDELKADRTKLRAFAEESMRLRSPTQGLSTRTTSRDEVFQGVKVPKGSMLHLRWGAANRDPTQFECPHTLDLNRRPITRHLTFSAGPRTCPGNSLSRLEQTIAWDCLLDRLESIEYAPGNTFKHQPGIMLGTLELKLKIKKAV